MIEVLNLEDMIPAEILDALSPTVAQSILRDIADGARNEWIRLAGKDLRRTRRDYLSGLQPVELRTGEAVIALVGVLPNLIEQGMAAKDLHDTLLGPNVPVVPPGKRGKHPKKMKDGGVGYYRAIPFRHSVPGTTGAVGPAMGSAYAGHRMVADAKQLGKQVYGAAKALSATTSSPGSKTKYGGRLKEGMAPKLRPHHKTDIYAGMIREEKAYQAFSQQQDAAGNFGPPKGPGVQSQYYTFRMISTGSPGWRRKRTEGKHYAKKVNEYTKKVAPQAFDAFVKGLGA